MKILLIGNGGREHALLRKLHDDAPGADFFITRGNGGTATLARPVALDPNDAAALAEWAELNAITLAVCGPEAPLAAGIAEHFARRRVPFFGPTQRAAEIEASKSYAKQLMHRAGVPTAAFGTFTDIRAAQTFIEQHDTPVVVKASGLAGGKGAVICDSVAEALGVARAMLTRGVFGAAGNVIVVEEFLRGEELSVFALTDGTDALLLLPAQDHKPIGEGDRGPNTGGMGAYAPVSIADASVLERIERAIILPTLAALTADGNPFRGLLYAGVMLTAEGPHVIEFNARFGDPETQVILPLLESSLLDPMLAIARGAAVRGTRLTWRPFAALTTVLAAGGYPGSYATGDVITIPREVAESPDVILHHAGTALHNGQLVTAGGRVLAVTGIAADMATAAEHSRSAASAIEFRDRYFRTDIGWRELARCATTPR